MSKEKKILAVASKGGHWVQLQRLSPVWAGASVAFVTNDKGLRVHVGNKPFYAVVDANMDQKLKLLILALQMLWLVLKIRPDVVISTGAAPGFFAIVFARILGAKTVWVDSVANAEELSLAGKKVGRFCSVWLTQWPEVAAKNGPVYKGRVF